MQSEVPGRGDDRATAAADAVLRPLAGALPAMADLLERLLRAPDPVRIAARELEAAGLEVRTLPGAPLDHVYARPRLRRHDAPRQLLLARLDRGRPEAPLPREGGRLHGPGAAGGAGGVVALVFALRALAAAGIAPEVTPVVLVTGDEAGGSRDSTRIVRLLARGAARALVLGPPPDDGDLLVMARVGSGRFAVRALDDAAEPGLSSDAGARMVLELARLVPRLLALADPVAGVTVDVGAIEVHPRRNGDLPAAGARVVVRARTDEAARRAEAALRALEPLSPGTVLEVHGGFDRPPMERLARNRALYGAAVRLGRELGLALGQAPTAATASHANTTSRYTATLDGLGPRAAGAGTADEHVVLASIRERAALLALLLTEPPGHPPVRPRRLRPRSGRVAIVGSAANEANFELVAGWQPLGIDVDLVQPRDVRIDDVVLGRLDVLPTLDGTEPGLLELLLFERRGIRVLNGAFATALAHDKLLTARRLARAGLPHPRTVHLVPGRPVPLLPPPLVVKPRFGSWGADVYRCETRDELDACLAEVGGRDWFRRHGVLLQELVPPQGRDVRLLVAAGRAVGAIERLAGAGEWRTNISLGGSFRPLTPPEDACRLAEAAALALGADLVGVDLLPVAGGFTVLELNGAVEFDARYSLPGRDVFRDAAAALGLLPAEGRPDERTPAVAAAGA